jgi:hypothetical protein
MFVCVFRVSCEEYMQKQKNDYIAVGKKLEELHPAVIYERHICIHCGIKAASARGKQPHSTE